MIRILLTTCLFTFLMSGFMSCTPTGSTDLIDTDAPYDVYYEPNLIQFSEVDTTENQSVNPIYQGSTEDITFSISNISTFEGGRLESDPDVITINADTGFISVEPHHNLVAGIYMVDVIATNKYGQATDDSNQPRVFNRTFTYRVAGAGEGKAKYSTDRIEGTIGTQIVTDEPFIYGKRPVEITIANVEKNEESISNHQFAIDENGIVSVESGNTLEAGNYIVSIEAEAADEVGSTITDITFVIQN